MRGRRLGTFRLAVARLFELLGASSAPPIPVGLDARGLAVEMRDIQSLSVSGIWDIRSLYVGD